MFQALMPPCEAGRGPGKNSLMCERCGVGQYAPAQSYCQACPEGGKAQILKAVWRLLLNTAMKYIYIYVCMYVPVTVW